jgi:hypothetical protein
LSERWTQQLGGSAVAGWSIARCEVLGVDAGGPALVVALSLDRAGQSQRVFAHAAAEPRAGALQLTRVRLSPESSAALAALEVPPAQVEALLQQRAALPLAEHAARKLAQIGHKLSALTLGLSPVALTLGDTEYQALGAAGEGLLFGVRTTLGATPLR